MKHTRNAVLMTVMLAISACVTGPKLDGTSSPQELNNYANRLDDAGRSDEALRYYEAALSLYKQEEQGDRANCYYNYGLALRRLGRLAEAVVAYEKSLQLDPSQERTYVNMGLALEKAGRGADAHGIYARGLKRFPDSLFLMENMALLLIRRGDAAAAVQFVKRAVQIREARPGLQDNRRYLPVWRDFLEKNP